jgi:hypothetical protein
MITRRRPAKEDRRTIIDTNAHGLRGNAYSGPKVNKNRDDVYAVTAYDEGYRGKTQKRRPAWPYQT